MELSIEQFLLKIQLKDSIFIARDVYASVTYYVHKFDYPRHINIIKI